MNRQVRAQVRRLLIAIAAWPAGLIVAALVVFVPAFFDSSCEPGTGACMKQLEPVSSTRFAIWLAIAFGPGILATRAWWKNRGARADEE